MYTKETLIILIAINLHKIDWNNKIKKNSDDINEIFNIFYKTFCEIVDHHVPLIKVTKKERTLQLKQ